MQDKDKFLYQRQRQAYRPSRSSAFFCSRKYKHQKATGAGSENGRSRSLLEALDLITKRTSGCDFCFVVGFEEIHNITRTIEGL